MVPSPDRVLAWFVLLFACGPAVAVREPAPVPMLAAAAASSSTCPPDNPLTWRSFGDGFLRTWCTGCHSSTLPESERQGAPTDVNFDRADLYRPHARAVLARAVEEAPHGSPMPPAGLVPEADRRRLAQWIACGSP